MHFKFRYLFFWGGVNYLCGARLSGRLVTGYPSVPQGVNTVPHEIAGCSLWGWSSWVELGPGADCNITELSSEYVSTGHLECFILNYGHVMDRTLIAVVGCYLKLEQPHLEISS